MPGGLLHQAVAAARPTAPGGSLGRDTVLTTPPRREYSPPASESLAHSGGRAPPVVTRRTCFVRFHPNDARFFHQPKHRAAPPTPSARSQQTSHKVNSCPTSPASAAGGLSPSCSWCSPSSAAPCSGRDRETPLRR